MDQPSQPSAAPAAADPPAATTPPSTAAAMLEALYEKRSTIRTLMVAYVDDKGQTRVDWSRPFAGPAITHLQRMMDVRINRHYERQMFGTEVQGPVAGVKASPQGTQVAQAVKVAIGDDELARVRRKKRG